MAQNSSQSKHEIIPINQLLVSGGHTIYYVLQGINIFFPLFMGVKAKHQKWQNL